MARRLTFVGSVKWLASPFDAHDLARLRTSAPRIPGFITGDTGLAVVSQSGVADDLDLDGVGLVWTPDDAVSAWGHS